MTSKFAAFDIDGTLIRWQMYHAIIDELIKSGVFEINDFAEAKAARMRWKMRESSESFKAYESVLVSLFDEHIKNLKITEYESAVDRVFDKYKDQTYTYTRNLIQDLRSRDYKVFAISGSDQVIVKKLAEHYKFDDFGGSNYKIENGSFTGDFNILTNENKPKFLAKLIEKHGLDTRDSIAIGDSEGDIALLEAVENPIAFNPSAKLLKHAQEKGWKIVIERKNVCYELVRKNDSYAVANTIY